MRSAESVTYKEWLCVLKEAIRQFNANETYLIKNDLSERCINSKFAMYVERVLADQEIEGVDVDVEYNRGFNRSGYLIKNLQGKRIFPDMVIHKREYDDEYGFLNLICVEMKKEKDRRGFETDLERLRALTYGPNGFGFRIGAFVVVVGNKRLNDYRLEIREVFVEGETYYDRNAESGNQLF